MDDYDDILCMNCLNLPLLPGSAWIMLSAQPTYYVMLIYIKHKLALKKITDIQYTLGALS